MLLPRIMFIALLFVKVQAFSRINFIHIPKTGGSTVECVLGDQFSIYDYYPLRYESSQEDMYNNLAVNYKDYEFLSGHLSVGFLKESDLFLDESFSFTVLREPVDRFLSLCRYLEKNHKIPFYKTLRDGPFNSMCRFLASSPKLQGQELLESAKKNLEKLNYVMFLDTLENDLKVLLKLIGVCAKDIKIPKLNATAKKIHTHTILDYVREKNSLDILLYEYAVNHFKNDLNPYFQEYKNMELLKNPTSYLEYTFDMPMVGNGWGTRWRINTEDSSLWVFKRPIIDNKASLSLNLIPGKDYKLMFNAKKTFENCEISIEVSGEVLTPIKDPSEFFGYSQYSVHVPKELISEEGTKIFFCCSQANSVELNRIILKAE